MELTMKQTYISKPVYSNNVFVECKTRATAKRRTPWASRWAKVEGGWIAFEYINDYELWMKQN